MSSIKFNRPSFFETAPQAASDTDPAAPKSRGTLRRIRGATSSLVHSRGQPTSTALSDAAIFNSTGQGLTAARITSGEMTDRLAKTKRLTDPTAARKARRLGRKIDKAIGKLNPLEKADRAATADPDLLTALHDEAACRTALAERFDGAGSQRLIDALAGLRPGVGQGDTGRYTHTLRLATVLRHVADRDAVRALALLQSLRPRPAGLQATLLQQLPDAAPPPADLPAATAALKRALAATATGMDALLHAEEKDHWSPAQREGYRDALNICGWLAGQTGGWPLAADGSPADGSLDDFMRAARAAPRIAQDIGRGDDHPLQLASKALLHAQAKMAGRTSVHLGACVAWRNGFFTSGDGTPFNRMLQGLGKFREHHRRATAHGPRTAGNLVRDTGLLALNLVGKHKPLLETLVGHGTLGAEQALGHAQGAAFGRELREVLLGLRAPLEARALALRDGLRSPEETAELLRLNVRMALLDLWHDKGIKGFRPSAAEVRDKLSRFASHLPTDPQALEAELRRHWLTHKPGKLRLSLLETWAFETHRPTRELRGATVREMSRLRQALQAVPPKARSPQQSADLAYAEAMLRLANARYLANSNVLARQDRTNLFQARDLWNIVRRKPARDTADAESVAATVRQLSQSDNLLQAQVGTRWGINTVDGPMFGLLAGASPVLVGPEVGLRLIKGSTCGMGTTKIGFVFYLGSQGRSVNGNFGVMVGAKPPLPTQFASVGINGTFGSSGQKTVKAGETAILTAARERDGGVAGESYLLYADRISRFMLGTATRPQPLSGDGFWAAYVAEFGDTDKVSVGLSTETTGSLSHKAKLSVNAMAGTGSSKFGPNLFVGGDHNSVAVHRQAGAGRTQVHSHTLASTGIVSGGIALATQSPLSSQTADGHQVTGKTVPLVGYTKAATVSNLAPSLHLTEEDGRLRSETCFLDISFADPESLEKHVNLRRRFWDRVAKFTSFDGRALTHAEAIDQFIREAKNTPCGEFNFYERLRLDPAVARTIDLLKDEAFDLGLQDATLTPGLQLELQRLRHKPADLLHDENSWLCRNLYRSQVKSEGHTLGLPVGLEVLATKTVQAAVKELKVTASDT